MGIRDDTNKIVVYGHLKIRKGIARCMKAQTESREGLLVQNAERCSSEVYHRCCLQDPKCLALSKSQTSISSSQDRHIQTWSPSGVTSTPPL